MRRRIVMLRLALALEKAPPGAVVLAVAAVGLAVLGGALAHSAPRSTALGDLGEHEGARVAVEARVLSAGPRALTLADASARITAFPPRGADAPAPGDEVAAVGTVTRTPSGLALSLESVRVIARPHERVLAVGDLAAAPTRFDGSSVTVAGRLERAPHEGWRLIDPWWGARVAVDVSPVPGEWESGSDVVLAGRFHLDGRLMRYEVTVDAWRPAP